MSNLVLYRKYRPQKFCEISGQEHIVQTISNEVGSNMVSHAYIFSGPRGSGKTTIARILAKAINCRNRKDGESEPCDKCDSCMEIMENRSMDIIEIDAASHRGIDEIRELKDNVKFAPVKEKYKVLILDEAHQLTKEAVNALLKVLEEPPAHAIFIMATTEIHKMIPTIISRCQRFDFRKLKINEIVGRLEEIAKLEKAKIEKPALELIAINSGGAMRDAIGLLDQILAYRGEEKGGIKTEDIKEMLGVADTEAIAKFVDFVITKRAGEALEFLNEMLEKGYDDQEFAKSLINYLRQAMLVKINPDKMNPIIVGLTESEQENLKNQGSKLTPSEISRMINLFMEAEGKMKYSTISQLPLELAVVDLAHLETESPSPLNDGVAK